MKFRFIPGRKKEGDRILLIQTDGEEAVKMVDVAKMVVYWYRNEENLYPPPGMGGEFFLSFILDCIQEPENIDIIAERYKLKGLSQRGVIQT